MVITQEVFQRFSQLLGERLVKGTGIEEDVVRYSLFASLTEKASVLRGEILLEYGHPNIPRAKIDGYLPLNDKHGAAVWELKYDRRIPSGYNQPRSNKAGALINDVFRLGTFEIGDAIERLLIYLTDEEMKSYLTNTRNGFNVLFGLAPGGSFRIDRKFLDGRAPSVRNKVHCPLVACDAVARFTMSLPCVHELRVYEIRRAKA